MREFIIITLKVPTFILDFHLFLLEFGWAKKDTYSTSKGNNTE